MTRPVPIFVSGASLPGSLKQGARDCHLDGPSGKPADMGTFRGLRISLLLEFPPACSRLRSHHRLGEGVLAFTKITFGTTRTAEGRLLCNTRTVDEVRRSQATVPLGAGALCLCLVFGVVMATQQGGESSAAATTVDPAGGTGSFLLTATNTGPRYAPTFTGNGELGVRVPPRVRDMRAGRFPRSRSWQGSTLRPPGKSSSAPTSRPGPP